jgi:hypothetical protein
LTQLVKGTRLFNFGQTFGEDTTAREGYDGMGKGISVSVVSGLNRMIFAYGQTRSGKTYNTHYVHKKDMRSIQLFYYFDFILSCVLSD